MSYGKLFLPEEKRLQPDISRLYDEIQESHIRSNIKPIDSVKNREAQEIGRLFNIGVDAPEVRRRLKGTKQNSFEETILPNDVLRDTFTPYNPNEFTCHPILNIPSKAKITGNLSVSDTISQYNHLPGNKFNIPHVTQPYEERFEALPSKSVYNLSTPKMWPPDTQFAPTQQTSTKFYDSTLRDYTETSSFGKKSSSGSLKKRIYEATGHKVQGPNISSQPCSKSSLGKLASNSCSPMQSVDSTIGFNHSRSSTGKLTALQSTLHECGRLKIISDKDTTEAEKILTKSIEYHKKGVMDHIKWLQAPLSDGDFWHHDEAYNLQSSKSISKFDGNKSVGAESSISSNSAGQSWQQISQIDRSNKSLNSNPTHVKVAAAESAHGVQLHTFANSKNPFRMRRSSTSTNVRYSRSVPTAVNPLDTMAYKDDILIRKLSNYNACIQPSIDVKGIPSKKEVMTALMDFTKKQIRVYHAKVVECASLIKALRHTEHPTPGLQALLSLHQAFIHCSAANVNPFVLSKSQLYKVITRELDWADKDSVSRLLLAFDGTNTGIIRYIQISSTLLVGMEPAIMKVTGSVDVIDNNWLQQYVALSIDYTKSTSSLRKMKTSISTIESPSEASATASMPSGAIAQSQKSHKSCISYDDSAPREEKLSEEEWKDFRGEVLVLRFLHQLYAECAGKQLHSNHAKTAAYILSENQQELGRVRIEDLKEMFTCVALSVDDANKILALTQVVIQRIFEKHINLPDTDMSSAALNRQSLRSSTQSDAVSLNQHSVISAMTTASANSSLALSNKQLSAETILKYPQLKAMFDSLFVLEEEFIDAVLRYPPLLREFVRQTKAFRAATKPYLLNKGVSANDTFTNYNVSNK